MNIGILGGGFDPVHIGHIISADYLLNEKIFDKIIVIPCYRQPLKEEYKTPFWIRLNMAQDAFGGYSEIEVSDVESRLPLPSYTIYTLIEIKKMHKNDKLFLIIGDDEAMQIEKWHRFEEISQYAEYCIIRRKSKTFPKDKYCFENAIIADNPLIEISSSYVRKLVFEGKRISHFVPESVEKIIKREKLYIE